MRPQASEKPARVDRREWLAILVATLIGAGLRAWHLDRLGLTHFDEGIYAIAGLWSVQPGGISAYQPSSVAYAPPGFPILVGLSYITLGVSDLAAIVVSIVAGIATIPMLGWLGRRSFGPGAGAMAAALGAISGAHVAFSRMAMTDVSFLLSWMIALAIGGLFLERPTIGRAILLGLSVGLAQHFKYNGWLAGIVVALAAIPGQGFRRDSAKLLGLLSLAGGVAAVSYVPWYRFVEAQPGGYSALLKHHASYLKGIDSWPGHWRAQLDQAVALSGGPTWGVAAWSVGWIGGVFSAPRSRMTPRVWASAISILVLGCVALGMLPNLPWWLSLSAMPWLLRDPRPAARVIAASWLGLEILTPFYHPYARLWLPTLAAGWLIVGGLASESLVWLRGLSAIGPDSARSRSTAIRWGVAFLGIVAAIGTSIPMGRVPRPHGNLLGPTDSVREAVAGIHKTLGDAPTGIVLLGRPPIVFYGMLRGKTFGRLEHVSDLEAGKSGFAVVEDSQLRQEGEPSVILRRLGRRWDIIESFPDVGSVPTILDEEQDGSYDRSSGSKGRLWLLRPRPGASRP